MQGDARMEVRKWKLGQGAYAGNIRLVDGQLSYTPFQSLLARFLNDRGLLELALTGRPSPGRRAANASP